MEPTEAKKLELGAAVWVWIVRFGKGRWWPGTVEGIRTAAGLPIVEVRLQSFSLSQYRNNPPISVGLVSAPMRRLERRDINRQGLDRPRFLPASRLRRPEKPIPVDARAEAADTENLSGQWIQHSSMNLRG
jgi:hypothetical protein